MVDHRIKIFLDGADEDKIIKYSKNEIVKGFTTNPTLMKKAGVKNYKEFALKMIKFIDDKPISFEVFADEHDEMYEQAKIICSWGKNINVKIPVTNTKGVPSYKLINQLSKEGININITAIFTLEQAVNVINNIDNNSRLNIVSIFAGRIADAGVDPVPTIKKCVELIKKKKNIEILWASTREVFNIIQARECHCSIITVSEDILLKTSSFGKDLNTFSLETVKMFYEDAKSAKYILQK
jgi:transaldolase